MTVTVLHLGAGARPALLGHLLALPAEDRRLRFGSSLSSEGVAAYVDSIGFDRDVILGVHDDRLALVGAVHVAFGEGFAELGLSVLPAHRGRGVGSALFERGAAHARNRGVSRLLMHCLVENTAIMRIARRAGMDVVTDAGDADAGLDLAPASPASIAADFVADRLALYDYALMAEVATWRGINAALQGAARPAGSANSGQA